MKPIIPGEAPVLIPIRDVARLISVCVRQVYRKVDEGLLPAPVKQGRKSYFFRKDIDNYLEGLRRA